MAKFFSGGKIANQQKGVQGIQRRTVELYNFRFYDYATLYRLQSNVRTCVDFLARNIAQLDLHVYKTVDGDKERVRDHPLANLLKNPLPPEAKFSGYRLFESLASDIGIYANAFWVKLKNGSQVVGLLRVPPTSVSVFGTLVPEKYEIDIGGEKTELKPEEIVHFRLFNPENQIYGLSNLETLRNILAEEQEAAEYRQNFWRNGARIGGIIQRPAEAPKWSNEARGRFKNEWVELYASASNSGRTAVLEDGMTYNPSTFSARDSEYLASRKLTREECARAYHIPPPMVGILDNATFSNITEQHKQLYTDTLGPYLEMIQQDLETQLLPDFDGLESGVYIEFNIAKKLQGDFKDQAASLQSAVGVPWMTPNEVRSIMNLPKIEGGDVLQQPLNMAGGQPKTEEVDVEEGGEQEEQPDEEQKSLELKSYKKDLDFLRTVQEKLWISELTRYYNRVRRSVLAKNIAADIGTVFVLDRWNKELKSDLKHLNYETILAFAQYLDQQTGMTTNPEFWESWIDQHSEYAANDINDKILQNLKDVVAKTDEEDLDANLELFFTGTLLTRAKQQATTSVTTAMNFGLEQAATAAGKFTKTWRTGSTNPRSSHMRMNGQTVKVTEKFSNGLRWPGDPTGDAEDNANCKCYVQYN